MPLDVDVGESLAEPSRSRFDLRCADVATAIDHLAREVREFDRVGIDERQLACARARERPQCGDAQSSDADDQYSFRCHLLAHLPSVESATRSVLIDVVKNPAETVRRGLHTLALSSRRF